MKANDRDSGIRDIQYIVNDVTTGTEVWNGTVNGQKETEVLKNISKQYSSQCLLSDDNYWSIAYILQIVNKCG